MSFAVDNVNRKFRKFDHTVKSFIMLDGSDGRVGIIFEFVFGNGLGVSVADHSEISGNQGSDCVSLALIDPNTNGILSKNKVLDEMFGLIQGVTVRDRGEVAEFLSAVKKTSVLDFASVEHDCEEDF